MLTRNHLLVPGRTVMEAVDVCSLSIEARSYPVINLVEQVNGMASPRGVRRAIVLKPNLQMAYELPYYLPAKPLFCHANELIFSAPVEIENTLPEGKRVSFANGAADAEVLADP